MPTVYQIYLRRKSEKYFHECGSLNRFWTEKEAIERREKLIETWKDYGHEYIIVELACK